MILSKAQANHLRGIIILKRQYIQTQKRLNYLQGLFNDKEKMCQFIDRLNQEIQLSDLSKKIPTPPPTPPAPAPAPAPSPAPAPAPAPPPAPVWRPW